MDSSQFSNNQSQFEAVEQLNTQGATCDAFRVKLYGKLHFLKQLKPEYAGDVRYREALQKEFETGYRLEHPHLVRYLSLTGDGLLMEYVDGETLSQRLANHPDYFDEKNTKRLLRQLLDVVGYLHAHQVLHLDLKPDNIMLTRIHDDVKLVDLGCCYTDTFADTQGRTDRYAAPEQLDGRQPDERTDIYAIGKILEQLPCHQQYHKVIARCTALNPANRYQSVRDLQDTLFARSRRWIWLLAAIILIVLPFGYFLYTSQEQPSKEKIELPTEVEQEKKDTSLVIEAPRPVPKKEKKEEKSVKETLPTTTMALGPIRSELSEEEKEFLNQPTMRVISSDEFTSYKQQLDKYFSEANAFLDDTTNLQRYSSHISYMSHYMEIVRRALDKINADEWFRPLYSSPLNPVSSYTRKYNSAMEHRAFEIGNKLP